MDALPSQELPPGWAVAPLGDLIDGIEAGKNVAAIGRPPEDGETGIVKVSAVTWGEFDEDESKALHPGTEIDPADLIRPGDFLISRANTIELVGAPVIVKQFRRRLVLSDKVLRLRVVEGFDRWLELFLKSHFGRTQIEQYATGAQLSMRNISQENLRRISVPVAPEDERARIVAAVNELFEAVEAGEAALARAREGLTQFRASLLHAACTGALTADWRTANPTNTTADDLLTAALDLRRKLWPGRYEAPVTIAADMPALPAGWRWATLDQLAILPARNGISVKGNPEPPGVAALRLDAMQGDGLDFTRRRYIDIPANKAADLAIREGDFLISRANGSLALMGRACVAGIPPVPTVFPDTMIRFRLASAELARWAAVGWRSVFVREHLERRAKTSAGIWKISQDDMRSAPIPLPPSHEITAILDALATAQVENGALPADGFADALRQSILHVAFTGRLVPQDPADEPAAALLARLRAAPSASRRPRARRTATQPDLIETPA